MLKRCYLVETSKGDALFLDEARADDYAAQYHGIKVKMYGQTFGGRVVVQQAGNVIDISDEQLQQNPPDTGEVCPTN